jgi:archaemetzincin
MVRSKTPAPPGPAATADGHPAKQTVGGKTVRRQYALLELIPLGHLDPMVLSVAAANLQAVLGLDTDIAGVRPQPDYAFSSSRRQYDAVIILKHLAAEKSGAPLKLGITPYDLCIPILTYVYGESQLGGRAAVVSVNRLIDRFSQERTFDRIAKICVHEVGHILGLEHCWENACLMRFSKQLAQLDQLPLHFCTACEYEIARGLRRLMKNPTQHEKGD